MTSPDEDKKIVSIFAHLTQATFKFRAPDEAKFIASLFLNICPTSKDVLLGLSELMLNAIEHGNLGISYDEESQLLKAGKLHEELQARLEHPDYAFKNAELSFERDNSEIRFIIKDEGVGFDWRKYQDLNSDGAASLHGRGIALAKIMGFDQIEFHDNGREVHATIFISERTHNDLNQK